MTALYTQQEAAKLLGFRNYRSLNKLVVQGVLECIKRPGKRGRKMFTEEHIKQFIKNMKYEM